MMVQTTISPGKKIHLCITAALKPNQEYEDMRLALKGGLIAKVTLTSYKIFLPKKIKFYFLKYFEILISLLLDTKNFLYPAFLFNSTFLASHSSTAEALWSKEPSSCLVRYKYYAAELTQTMQIFLNTL